MQSDKCADGATSAAAACRDHSDDKSSMSLSKDNSGRSSSSKHNDSNDDHDTLPFVAAAAGGATLTVAVDDKRCVTPATYTVDALTGLMTFHGKRALRAYAQLRQTLWQQGHLPHKPCLVVYKHGVYDVSEFVHAHPGGNGALERFHTGDVTLAFHDETHYHAHSRTALSILCQHRVGSLEDNADEVTLDAATEATLTRDNNNNNDNGSHKLMAAALAKATPQPPSLSEDGAAEYPIITPQAVFYRNFTIRRDRGMMWQAMNLPLDQYIQFVDQPVFLMQCRLFDTNALELLTRTKHWVVPILWLPLSAYWALRGVLRDYTQLNEHWGSRLDRYLYYPNNNWLFHNYPAPVTPHMSASYVHTTMPDSIAHEQLAHAHNVSQFCLFYPIAVFLLGLFAWTPLEYCLHRFAFHYDRLLPRALMDNPLAKFVHLTLHGIHHVIPMDRDRLVLPPPLFAIVCYILYHLVGLFVTGSCLDLVAAGLTLGYVCYDEIHYANHHVQSSVAYFIDLRHYHHDHHYIDSTRAYGVTNKLWDWVFNTMLHTKV